MDAKIQLELEVVRDSHPYPTIKDPDRVFDVWLLAYKDGDRRDRRNWWPIGHKVRYTREEAIKQAEDISKALGCPVVRTDP
jgi:hypothetical protein